MAATAWVTKTLRPRLFLQRAQETWGEGSQGSARSALRGCALRGGCRGSSDPRPFPSLCSAQQAARTPIPSLGSQVARSRCLQRHWPLASYLHFTVQEGIGFPEPISNYRNLGSLEKLTDLEQRSSPGIPGAPRRHAALTRGHPAGSGSAPQPVLLPAEGQPEGGGQ